MRHARLAGSLGLDLVLLIVFAALGRNSHDESLDAGGVLSTAAPFLIGYAVAAGATRLDRAPLSVRRAIPAWLGTIALGMLLRRFVFDRGTALSFVIVALVATGVLLLGWRVLRALIAGRRSGS